MNDNWSQWCLSVNLYFVTHLAGISKLWPIFCNWSYIGTLPRLFASVAAFTSHLQSQRLWPTGWKYSLALYRKVCGLLHCSVNRHIRKFTKKANLVHHGWESHTSGQGMKKNSSAYQGELSAVKEQWLLCCPGDSSLEKALRVCVVCGFS